MTFRLRYKPGTNAGTQFAHVTYPMPYKPGYATRERAETVLAAMPEPARMEVFCDDGDA